MYIKKLRVLGGAIDDFSKAVAKIPYAATVELSGTDRDGYVNRVENIMCIESNIEWLFFGFELY